MTQPAAALILISLAAFWPLKADVAVLVGEPFGKFGFFNPTGHAAVYLSRVCAATPTSLRMCRPSEPGVVISRYRNIGGYDWLAVPLPAYLYATEQPDQITPAGAPTVRLLRQEFLRRYLRNILPPEKLESLADDWMHIAGASYDRNIYGFLLPTAPEDDERLAAYLNSKPNRRRFNLLFRNCADFVREIVNFYYPNAIQRNIFADAGITTPKQAARSLVRYAARHTELEAAHFLIMQAPGGRPSSRTRGVTESVIRSKKYVAPLVILQPWVAAAAAVAYISSGRFNLSRRPHLTCPPETGAECLNSLSQPGAADRTGKASKGEPATGPAFDEPVPYPSPDEITRSVSGRAGPAFDELTPYQPALPPP